MNKNRTLSERGILLEYKRGEQIFKQNDLGISIYRILAGKVEIFREHLGVKTDQRILGQGDILGGSVFLPKGSEVRRASARALEDCRLEVWHPRDLVKEYEKASPVLKYIADQAMTRLIRMNNFMDRLITDRAKTEERRVEEKEPRESKRRHYRKKVGIPCRYAPAGKRSSQVTLKGNVRDVSMTGLCLEADPKNDSLASHGIDEVFKLEFVLPNEKELKVLGKIVHVSKKRSRMTIGMVFPEAPDLMAEARKILGFFLLRT